MPAKTKVTERIERGTLESVERHRCGAAEDAATPPGQHRAVDPVVH